jgi:two-component system, LytTR family, response regulator
MDRIRTLIVDHEPGARLILRTMLAVESDVEIIGECVDGASAAEAIRETQPDLVFMEVQMPDLGGFEILESVNGGKMPAVVFVTAHDKYALRAFDVHALDYLLKPIDRDRFDAVVKRARQQLLHQSHEEIKAKIVTMLLDMRAGGEYTDRILVRTSGRVLFLRVEEIDWVEAQGNYLRIHRGTDSYLIRQTMTEMEGALDPRRFLRIHRSTIVNIERIREFKPMLHGDYGVVLRNGTELMLSRNYRHKVPPFLGNAL